MSKLPRSLKQCAICHKQFKPFDFRSSFDRFGNPAVGKAVVRKVHTACYMTQEH